MSLVPLARLLSDGRREDLAIARRDGVPMSLGRLRADTAHEALRLRRLGVRRAVLGAEDGYHFIVGLLALLEIGADILLPPNLQPETLRRTGAGEEIVLTALPLRGEGDARPRLIDPSRSRITLFTSGSTGEMKRIEKSALLLEREAEALERQWGERIGPAPVLGTVAHQHLFGLAFKIIWPLLGGRCIGAESHLAWESLLAALPPAAVIVTSPAHLTRLGGLAPLSPARRPRRVFTAGAPLPREAAIEADALFGVPPTEIFGSTETGAVAWREGEASWEALPGIEIGRSEAGWLRVRSPFAGEEGWCELADRIALQSPGRFVFEGRADRVHKIEGKRVSLERLEQALIALPWIGAAAVIALSGDGGASFLGAVAVLTPEGRAARAERGQFRFERLLKAALARSEDRAVLPRRWRFVEALPTDGMGKRRNADLARILAADP